MTPRTLLLVVGMHRSGTSALCAALQAGGASFGDSLLDPMAGVNDEGFWEDQSVVAINERLLQSLDLHWYSVPADLEPVDWSLATFDALREEAAGLIHSGFGAGAVEAIKDPRLCITLPFWLALAEECGVNTAVCAISRAPLEVAASLHKRDGFPVGYGLHLYLAYRRQLAAQAPADTIYLSYEELLQSPAAVIARMAEALPLDAAAPGLDAVVRTDLRHQRTPGEGLLGSADRGTLDLAALAREIESAYPAARVGQELAATLVARGQQLTSLGEQHAIALATLDQRDASLKHAVATVELRDQQLAVVNGQLAETGGHLEQALQTIKERDQQIAEFDRRLSEIGQLHAQALALIEARDAQLERVFAKPAVGLLFKAMWSRESR